MKKILFIFNAKAGHAAIGSHLLEIIDAFNSEDTTLTVMTTRYAGHATELVRTFGPEYDMILTSGGDGTVNEIVSGVVSLEKKIPVAYIPTGTTNDFARSLGLSADIKKCIKQLTTGEPFVSDVGMLNDHAFIYVAAFGTPVNVTYTTPQEEKNMWGYPAYVRQFLRTLPNLRPYHLKISAGDRQIEGDYLFGFITNSYSVSGFKGVTGKNVSLNDGLFEFTLIRNVQNVVEFAELLSAAHTLLEEKPDEKYIERFAVSDLWIECDEELEWNVDGEFGGRFHDSKITVLSSAVTFIV